LNQAVLIGDHRTYIERYPASAETVAQLGFGARAAMPIHTGDGRVIGSMVHAWAGPRTFDRALVSTLTTIAEMAGQAIERARLVEQIQRDSARHEALASLAELLASARTTLEVAKVVAVHAAPVAGADSANLALLDDASGCMQVHHNPSLSPEVQARYQTVPLDAPIPHADALRDGQVLIFEDLDRFSARYPHLVDDLKVAGREACALVPLSSARGDRFGVLGLAWSGPIDLDPTDRAVLGEVGDLCAQAIERATLSDAEHHVVTTLQDSVLTRLPPGTGLDVAARYLPAAHHVGLGGDWYQGIALDDDRYAVIVGDVAGHGITAVGDMAQLKAVMGALVRIGLPLGDVFQETTSLLRHAGRAVTATALIVVVDAANGELAYAAAGHPPALLRMPDGEVIELRDGRQPLLGVVTDATARAAVHPFPVGSMLVVYTDGLVERRREALDRSISRLATELGSVSRGDAESVAAQLLASHVVDRDPDDDIALVVVTRTD
jgi:GAF domain-containing protein